jgi:hypothetical protein
LFGDLGISELLAGACSQGLPYVLKVADLNASVNRRPPQRDHVTRQRVTLLRAVSDPHYLLQHGLAVASALTYAVRHDYSLHIYVGVPDHFNVTGHFSRLPAIFAALYHPLLNLDLVSYDDLDTVFNPSLLSLPIEAFTQQTRSPIIVNGEPIPCSCSLMFRKGQAAAYFLALWWHIGHTTMCCNKHTFDQVAWWEALSRTLQNHSLPGTFQVFEEPRQEYQDVYCKQLHAASRNASSAWPVHFMTQQPTWHGSSWGNDFRKSVVYHTSHFTWEKEYELVRSWLRASIKKMS